MNKSERIKQLEKENRDMFEALKKITVDGCFSTHLEWGIRIKNMLEVEKLMLPDDELINFDGILKYMK